MHVPVVWGSLAAGLQFTKPLLLFVRLRQCGCDSDQSSNALPHAKEATTLDPSYAWAFSTEADALFSLRRFQEAINASKEAIRLSDGKFTRMHFRLGASYFETENWDLARQSFEKAAELDPSDEAAPYNVALCYSRIGYQVDAAHWFEEVLKRNPNRADKAELQERIRTLLH